MTAARYVLAQTPRSEAASTSCDRRSTIAQPGNICSVTLPVKMISEIELRHHAETHELSEANVQRDYVFGWLISGLFRTSSLADALVLKGGNMTEFCRLPR